MKKIELPSLGIDHPGSDACAWADLLDAGLYRKLVDSLVPGSSPSIIQQRVIRDADLLTSRRNLLVSSSTNSGKTLLGYLALLRGVTAGKRVLLLEPLRALAHEKYAELSRLAVELEGELGRQMTVTITTGDYRLNHETMQAAPPDAGEIVVATPERIESILRNSEFDEWMQSIAVAVVDEGHLLGDRLRGASLEYVITSMNLFSVPPRFLLLSATLGDTEELETWLAPCDAVVSSLRSPELHRALLMVDDGEDVADSLAGMIKGILEQPDTSVLVFVYQTAAADKLARDLKVSLGELAGPMGPKSYHSRQRASAREDVGTAFRQGDVRCVVSTTALAMGVNLPATHVIIRDLSRGAGDKVRVDELIQMSGRAGRGDKEGCASFVLKPKDPWTEEELRAALVSESLPPISSALIPVESSGWSDRNSDAEPALAEAVLSLLSRSDDGMKLCDIERFLKATLAGGRSVPLLQGTLQWLSSPSRMLVYGEDDHWKATSLGRNIVQSSMPLSEGSGIAQLLRDLMSVDDEDVVVRGLSKLDLLLVAELLATGVCPRLRYSERMAEQVDAWMMQSDEKSVLFDKWIRGAEGHSQADELLGSLGVGAAKGGNRKSRQVAYVATCRAILMWQRAQGVNPEDIKRRWGVKDVAEVEEKWRDSRLFFLGAISALYDVRCFYYHLKEDCSASRDRVIRVKRALQQASVQTYQLLDLISWCSPLGPFFVRMRTALSGKKGSLPGQQTMRTLEGHGVHAVSKLNALKVDDLKEMGIRKNYAQMIMGFMNR
jgi:helicase